MEPGGLAPVLIFAYNRRDKLNNCLESLESNSVDYKNATDLYIFCDGSKNASDEKKVTETQNHVKIYEQKSTYRSVTVQYNKQNKGLANSIIQGVNKIINIYGKAIVLEDDLLVSKDFLEYMNKALDYYQYNDRIGAISAYSYPIKILEQYEKDVYFLEKGDCWGWATWADRWKNAEWANVDYKRYFKNIKLRNQFEKLECYWDSTMYLQMKGKVDSWAIRWVYHLFRNHQLTVYPRMSRISNNGFDNSGTHCASEKKYTTDCVNDGEKVLFERNVVVDRNIAHQASIFPRNNVLNYYKNRVITILLGLLYSGENNEREKKI